MSGAAEIEHPDDVRQRHQAALGLVYGFGVVGLVIGGLLMALALSTSSWWQGESAPVGVREAIWNEYQVGSLLFGVCLAAMVVTWSWSRYIEGVRERALAAAPGGVPLPAGEEPPRPAVVLARRWAAPVVGAALTVVALWAISTGIGGVLVGGDMTAGGSQATVGLVLLALGVVGIALGFPSGARQ